ncbi:Fic family protein [Nocardia farcinica]|uniref:Fic/DOC family protein n=1 Tax=Nocardia farcinica TaxID=37329 RepID=UPI000760F6DB|nr:Fic/DOC family protein [Nocardia farcinica]AXK85734.1 cell filamentation protein Fic [Nocardia farcinica]MBF6068075.1 Fic family protein [Nocardia farcinica]MBF6231807.1 Fic family protein [Nocardia farcinica]MBF6254212.1 Fic family protein [Nocardia farcinica]MBF6263270.1 Fic family protein [Nocardia farcinica]
MSRLVDDGATRPWESGNFEARWLGYFVPGTSVLRNRVGATTAEELVDAENDLVEVRIAELRECPDRVSRTYDLAHLQALHKFLFQDVYEWAGDLRTVGIEKGGESFCPPADIARPVDHIAALIGESDRLRRVDADDLPRQLAYLYDYVNFAHPFREGNGRTQREFFDQLLSESGRGLAWDTIDKAQLHSACHIARADSDLAALEELFTRIVDDEPAYFYD